MRSNQKWICFGIIAMLPASPAFAQLDGIRARLGSEVDAVRMEAVSDLVRIANDGKPYDSFQVQHARVAEMVKGRDSIDIALIGLLGRENEKIRKGRKGGFSEDYSEYYASLIECVAALRDERAIGPLIGALQAGTMAREGLVAIGSAAAAKMVIASSKGPDAFTRHGSLEVLNKLVAAGEVDSHQSAAIRAAFIAALGDSVEIVRLQALRGLEHFPDEEVRAAISKIAATDTMHMTMNGKVVYGVRDAAAKWLRDHPEAKRNR